MEIFIIFVYFSILGISLIHELDINKDYSIEFCLNLTNDIKQSLMPKIYYAA